MSDTLKPAELLAVLLAEHKPTHVYRGQNRIYPPPLWPSGYRDFIRSEESVMPSATTRMRGCGTHFHFCTRAGRDYSRGVHDPEYEARVRSFNARLMCASHIRNALGYAVTECLRQQAGWMSEGLDVTHDPHVAIWFALSEWIEGHRTVRTRSNPGVVYRFEVDTRPLAHDDLRSHDFYNCPSFIPAQQIFRLFASGPRAESLRALAEYRDAIRWDVSSFELDAVRRSRPFELLRFPYEWSNGRVELQHASILIPDYVTDGATMKLKQSDDSLLDEYGIAEGGRRVRVREAALDGIYLEDISTRKGAKKFLLDVRDVGDLQAVVGVTNREILPKWDASFDLLSNWIRPFYNSIGRYGTIPFPFNVRNGLYDPSVDAEALLDVFSVAQPERGFCR